MSLPRIMTAVERVARRVFEVDRRASENAELLKKYVQSRGTGLITNGAGLMGNNTNFSSMTFNSRELYSGGGSFVSSTLNGIHLTDELIPLIGGSTYRFSFAARTLKKNGTSAAYALVSCFDIDEMQILPQNIIAASFVVESEVNAGATSLVVASESRAAVARYWNTGSRLPFFYLCSYEYANSKGYVYPVGTYTQNLFTDGIAMTSVSFDEQTGVMSGFRPLKRGLSAGQAVGITRSGGTYIYPVAAMAGQGVPETWTLFAGDVSADKLRPGTAFVRVGWQFNRNSQAGNETAASAVDLYRI